MKNLKIFLVVLLALGSLAISLYDFRLLKTLEQKITKIETSLISSLVAEPVAQSPEPKEEFTEQYKNYKYFTGTIKKEKIPLELELGDYWYWLYFDEPYLLEENAAGFPMNVEKLQISFAENTSNDKIEEFTDKHVTVQGYLTWGFAESTVIAAESIEVK